jgi:hypothetical protein
MPNRITSLRSRRRTLLVAAAVTVAISAVTAAAALALGHGQPNVPAAKLQVLLHATQPPANPGTPAAKGVGAHAPLASTPPPPAHAGEIGTPGELGGVPVPFSSATFTVTNMWMDLRGNVDIHIYAGSLPSEASQGGIVVTLDDAVTGASLPGAGQFLTPTKVGPLTLTKVSGDTISFSYPGGAGSFSLSSQRFSM